MKLQVDMKAFRAALAAVGKVIPAKSPILIALCVRIVTNDNRIVLTGTNFDQTIEVTMAADVLTEGAACINFATLNAFCAAAKTESIVLEAEGKDVIVLRAGKSRMAVMHMDPREFPNFVPAEGELVTVDAAIFCRALQFCVAAAADKDVRAYLLGAAVLERDGAVHLWGSDGHAMHHAALPDLPGIGGGGVVPTDACATIIAAVEKLATAQAMISPRGWHVIAGAVRAWGKVIDGVPPNYAAVLDGFTGWQDVISAPREEIAQALSVASCGTDTAAGGARSLILTASEAKPLVLRGARGSTGVLRAGRAETETVAVAEGRVMLSGALFSRAIDAMKVPGIVLSVTNRDGTDTMKITPAQSDAHLSMLALLMGIRATAAEMADAA